MLVGMLEQIAKCLDEEGDLKELLQGEKRYNKAKEFNALTMEN